MAAQAGGDPRTRCGLIGDSATSPRAACSATSTRPSGEPFWRPPRSEARGAAGSTLDRPSARRRTRSRAASSTSPEHRRDLPAGTFVFVLSDFLAPPTRDDWLQALERRWEIVPVVIQDPSGSRASRTSAGSSSRSRAGAGSCGSPRAEVERRREANEERRQALLHDLRALDLDPVLVSSHEPRDVLSSFLTWADQRLFTRGRA